MTSPEDPITSIEIERRSGPERRGGGFLRKIRRGFTLLAMLLGGAASGALALLIVLAGDIYEYQDSVDGAHLPRVDVVVCLAGGRGRISAAGDIWYRYWESVKREKPSVEPPVFYVSGMGHQSTLGVLTRHLRRGVRDVMRPEDVVLETESSNTETNARWLIRYAEQKNWGKILLITSPYHMKRARYIFEKIFQNSAKKMEIETYSVIQEPFDESGEWRHSIQGIRVTLIEYMKWIYYRNFWRP